MQSLNMAYGIFCINDGITGDTLNLLPAYARSAKCLAFFFSLLQSGSREVDHCRFRRFPVADLHSCPAKQSGWQVHRTGYSNSWLLIRAIANRIKQLLLSKSNQHSDTRLSAHWLKSWSSAFYARSMQFLPTLFRRSVHHCHFTYE